MRYTTKGRLLLSIIPIVISILIPAGASALGSNDPLYRDNIGTYTVKCFVHENSSGNNVVGFVFGNHSKDPEEAERDANLFVSRFGPGHAKRHCRTQKKYTPRGAYDTSMKPM